MARSKSDICICPCSQGQVMSHLIICRLTEPYTDWNKWIYSYGMMLLFGDKKGLTCIRGHPRNPIEYNEVAGASFHIHLAAGVLVQTGWSSFPDLFSGFAIKATAKAFIIMGGDRVYAEIQTFLWECCFQFFVQWSLPQAQVYPISNKSGLFLIVTKQFLLLP